MAFQYISMTKRTLWKMSVGGYRQVNKPNIREIGVEADQARRRKMVESFESLAEDP